LKILPSNFLRVEDIDPLDILRGHRLIHSVLNFAGNEKSSETFDMSFTLIDIERDRRLRFVVVSRGQANLIGGSSAIRVPRSGIETCSESSRARARALGENNKRRCGEEQQVPEEV